MNYVSIYLNDTEYPVCVMDGIDYIHALKHKLTTHGDPLEFLEFTVRLLVKRRPNFFSEYNKKMDTGTEGCLNIDAVSVSTDEDNFLLTASKLWMDTMWMDDCVLLNNSHHLLTYLVSWCLARGHSPKDITEFFLV